MKIPYTLDVICSDKDLARIEKIRDQLSLSNSAEVFHCAFEMMHWATEAVCAGRVVGSVDPTDLAPVHSYAPLP